MSGRPDQPVFVHRFRSGGAKTETDRCICGKITWKDAILYWRQAPRWQILRQDVTWCGNDKL